jgi:uncharacterized membrane protein YkoI
MKNIVKNILLIFTGFVLSLTLITAFAEDVKTSVTKILGDTGIIQNETFITEEEAIAIAKAHVVETSVITKVELDRDDKEFEIKLVTQTHKFELEINAVTGVVREVEKELLNDDPQTETLLTRETVIEIARTIVGDARLVEFGFDDDDHPPYFELEFKGDGKEYELKIDAVTGAILQSKVEIDDDDDDDEFDDDDDDDDDEFDDDNDDDDDDDDKDDNDEEDEEDEEDDEEDED